MLLKDIYYLNNQLQFSFSIFNDSRVFFRFSGNLP